MQLTKSNGVALGAESATFTTDALQLGRFERVLFELAFTGSPTGSVTLQGGNTEANMTDITSPVALTADPASGSPIRLGLQMNVYTFLRLKWTRTGGTMTVTSATAEAF